MAAYTVNIAFRTVDMGVSKSVAAGDVVTITSAEMVINYKGDVTTFFNGTIGDGSSVKVTKDLIDMCCTIIP